MRELLSNLIHDGWSNSVPKLEKLLRDEMHGTNGLIKYCRDKFEDKRQEKLQKLRDNFLASMEVGDLDQQLENYTSGIRSINIEFHQIQFK